MKKRFVDNSLCACDGNALCDNCRFCTGYHTPEGRKALCEKIAGFLVFQPFYQHAIAQAMHALFPDKVVYDDEKAICSMLFEAVMFEDIQTGTTPFAYFVDHAPLSTDEKRLYEAWLARTRYQFFVVEKVIQGEELHLADLSSQDRYRVYENKGTATIKEGMVILARIVPFLKGWMITTEVVISYGSEVHEKLRGAYGVPIPQFISVQHYHTYKKQRMAS